jgi:apolipoprotein N-acyltransferase
MSDAKPGPKPILPLWAALVGAVVAGLGLTLAFPETGWWAIVFLAVPLFLVALVGRRAWSSVLVGLAFGCAFFLLNLSFTARYLGPVPWLALSLLEAALPAVLALPITLAYRWMPRLLPSRWVRLLALPALVAGLWTLREVVLGNFPYGGFPWARIGVTQVSGPFADLASWVGMSGLSFLVVFTCAAAVEYVRVARYRDLRTVMPLALSIGLLGLMPAFPTTDAGSMRVGAAQGNGPAGYFDRRGSHDVLNSQLEASAPLLGEPMDVLVWPEGSMDTDPTQDATTANVLDSLQERAQAPLLVAAITQEGDEYFNTAMVWDGGVTASYDKRHPVPFGEYVPDRWFYEMLAPDLIGLIGREYTPGTKSPEVDVDGVGVGLAICFDVIYDDVVWDGALGGAQLYVFQTNNADFRGTSENLQQLAFARMRAIEMGRSVVNISTVGTSQIIAPDGSEIVGIDADVQGNMIADVPLRTGLTPATMLGPWIQLLIVAASALATIALGVGAALRRSSAG